MSVLLTWHNASVQAFSMGLFFLISGYFTVGSYDRKGPRQFFKDRLLRLGIPLICYDFVIGPLMAYTLMHLIRSVALPGTELARAQCATIRIKLFKIGAVLLRNTRRVRFQLSSSYPQQALFALAAERLNSG